MADTTVDFDPATITVGEAQLLEDLAGCPYGETIRALMTMRASVKQMKAVAVVVQRRANPEFTVDDITDDMEIRSLHG